MKCDIYSCEKKAKWLVKWEFGRHYKTYRCSEHVHDVMKTLKKFGIDDAIASPFPKPIKIIFT